MRHLFILWTLFILLISCRKDIEAQAEHLIRVDINKAGSLDLSEDFTVLDIIHLELTDESVIGEISKIYMTREGILIVDLIKNNIFLFNRSDGEFIRTIGQKGEGPQEYILFNDVFFDEDTQIIYAHERIKRSMYMYNLSGEFINELPCKYWFKGFCKNKDGFWVYSCYPDENPEGYALMLLNDSLTDRVEGFLPQKNFFPTLEGTRFIKDKENLFYFIYPFSNIVYQLKNGQPIPYLQIDFGNKTLPYKSIRKLSDPQIYNDLLHSSGYLADITNPHLADNRFYFSFSYVSGTSVKYSAMYDLSKRQIDVFSGFKRYLPESSSGMAFESITFMEPVGVKGDEIIYSISPDVLSENDFHVLKENISSSLSRESNPLLFFIKRSQQI